MVQKVEHKEGELKRPLLFLRKLYFTAMMSDIFDAIIPMLFCTAVDDCCNTIFISEL